MKMIYKNIVVKTRYMSIHPISCQTWLLQKIPYESSVTYSDIIHQLTGRLFSWIRYSKDLEHTFTYDSFFVKYCNVLYSGYKCTSPYEPHTEYFDLQYLEEIHTLINEGFSLADHYQVHIPHKNTMNVYEFMRDVCIIYDPDDESSDEDEYDAV